MRSPTFACAGRIDTLSVAKIPLAEDLVAADELGGAIHSGRLEALAPDPLRRGAIRDCKAGAGTTGTGRGVESGSATGAVMTGNSPDEK
jgi:hypothetical protein